MRNFALLACAIYCINGFGHIIIGTILEPMVDHYGIAYGDGGQLIMNQFLGFLFGVLMAPFIVNLLGRKMTVMVALFLFMFSQFMIGILPNWSILLYSVPFGGAGIGILETIIAALIIGHLKEKKASILVLTEVFFGVGALLIPVISAFFIMTGTWNGSFYVVAVVTFITIVMWLVLPFGELNTVLKKEPKQKLVGRKKQQRKRYTSKQMPIIIAGAFFFFMYVGTEMVLPNFLPTILSITTTLSASALALSITVFWGAMTIGRLCMTFIIDRIGYGKLFVICCFGQLFSFIIFAVSPTEIIGFIAIFLSGLLMGGIFSIGLLIVNENFVGLEEWTTSLLVAMGGLGGAFLPKIAGVLIDRYTIGVTLWSLVLCAFVLVCLMGIIFYYKNRHTIKSDEYVTSQSS